MPDEAQGLWATDSPIFAAPHEKYQMRLHKHFEKMAAMEWGDDLPIAQLLQAKLTILLEYRPLQRQGYLPGCLEYLLLSPIVCKMMMAAFLEYQDSICLVSEKQVVL